MYNTATSEITYNSSLRANKENIIDFTGDTSVLYNVRPRLYDWKEDGSHHLGYIAEEIDEVCPDFGSKDTNGKLESIAWFNLLVYTIEEVKKLKAEIEILKSRQ